MASQPECPIRRSVRCDDSDGPISPIIIGRAPPGPAPGAGSQANSEPQFRVNPVYGIIGKTPSSNDSHSTVIPESPGARRAGPPRAPAGPGQGPGGTEPPLAKLSSVDRTPGSTQ
eukprot:172504-Hanusia_phi.AAC.2